MSGWDGVAGFAIALAASLLACRRILHRALRNTDTSGDEEYDRLVMSSILPGSRGTSFDKAAELLDGQDLGSFSLAGAKDGERRGTDRRL